MGLGFTLLQPKRVWYAANSLPYCLTHVTSVSHMQPTNQTKSLTSCSDLKGRIPPALIIDYQSLFAKDTVKVTNLTYMTWHDVTFGLENNHSRGYQSNLHYP